MKIKLLFLFTILIQIACQSQKNVSVQDLSESMIIKEAKKLVHKSERKIIKLELEKVFAQILITHQIDLSSADTLYIIRGVNFENGFIHGRIWNDEIMIHYFDSRESKNEKFALNPKISTTENSTTNFDSLIDDIENNNQEFIIKLANENRLLSGIPGWEIMSFKQNEQGKYQSTYFLVYDFGIFEKSL